MFGGGGSLRLYMRRHHAVVPQHDVEIRAQAVVVGHLEFVIDPFAHVGRQGRCCAAEPNSRKSIQPSIATPVTATTVGPTPSA